jgi:hypothetical protein
MATLAVELPLFAEPSYQYNAAIENQSRLFKFSWNDRTTSWHLDIKNEDGTVIVEGLKLVPSYPMLADYQLDQFGITGHLVLVQENVGQNGSANLLITDIPDRYVLYYIYEQAS